MAEQPIFIQGDGAPNPLNPPNPHAPPGEAPPDHITINQIRQDRQVQAGRPRNSRISRHTQLTVREKELLFDYMQSMAMTADPPFVITVPDWYRFLRGLTEGWSTTMKAPKTPKNITTRQFEHTHIEVGYLRENLPLTVAQKASGDVQRPERCAGAPAFFGLTLHYETGAVQWTWRDAKCSGLSPDYVVLNEGMTPVSIRADAMLNYDQHERVRVRNYNKELIIACARRTLKKWAQEGTGGNPETDIEDCTQDLQRLYLAGPSAQAESVRLTKAVASYMENYDGLGTFFL
ncbi:hypothetical protein NW762_003593 [Fusarium torreyae]|uniref:Uncharacterized protein n=1 Tax=Fusarium torreyae TaxID=1237075 RepID=A0A9W8VJ19_9HYPO|nr:hypothetical protein NW762_003593 [Fusarium torreyae]